MTVTHRSVMTLFSSPDSVYSHRARIVLAEKDIQAVIQQMPDQAQDGLAVLPGKGLNAFLHELLTGKPEQGLHCPRRNLSLAQGQNLTQKGETVPHTACTFSSQNAQSSRIVGHILLGKYPGHVLLQDLLLNALEYKMLTAADNGGRKLVRFSGGQDKAHMAGRFLQGFEQGIEG